jgi:predicted alpha-1,2-mannosidase
MNLDRRWVLAILGCAIACGDNTDVPVLAEVDDPLQWVDPTIGSGGVGYSYGSCFVGAAVPHGLVKLGPDTRGPFGTIKFQHYSGYYSDDNRIESFSHVHLHGAGLADYGVLAMLPTLTFDATKTNIASYAGKFSKDQEHATVGKYAVTFDTGIAAELTATARVGKHRYAMPSAGFVMLDLGKTLEDGKIDAARLVMNNSKTEITGSLHHRGDMSSAYGGYTLYFVIRTKQPWTSAQVWAKGLAPSPATSASGTDVGAVLGVAAGVVEFDVALSLVSMEGARANLQSEGTIDFDATVAAAQQQWRDKLGTVLLTGGDQRSRRIFYSSFYHAFLMPTVIADADGTFALSKGGVQHANGWRQMSDMSLWDTYRTLAPLYDWLDVSSARDQARSLLTFAETLGGFPRWPVAIGESGTMIGSSAEIVVSDAAQKGIPGIEAERAYAIMRSAAVDVIAPAGGRGGRSDVEKYMSVGYMPSDVGRSVSVTTEYAHDDFALGKLAAHLGHSDDANLLDARRKSWRKLYDPAVGFLHARSAAGFFQGGFDPLSMSDEYTEANAWHSLWMAGAHDIDGLVELLGGKGAFETKLQTFLDQAKIDWDTGGDGAAAFPRPYYWHGNEPDLNAAFLFAQAGNPSLTQKWARWIMDTQYNDTAAGIAGNDDGGTLGAWYVFAALGLYPIPGSTTYVLSAPRFEQARVVVGGHQLLIVAQGVGDAQMYVSSVELDGVALSSPQISHQQLTTANELRFVMSATPTTWGNRE